MAVVYRGHDRELNRPVALKVLREDTELSASTLQRFRREAEVAAKLTHPSLVGVYDIGDEDARPFIVMELVEGVSLDRHQKEGKPSRTALVILLERVARGVAFAHDHGVIHRDLKPQNILVTPGGEPKVTDFGLAHLTDTDVTLTRTGTAVGTPLYMAPEQVRGKPTDISPRTDVYALGAILYEMLTGSPPHRGDTPAAIFARITDSDPMAPRKVSSSIPVDLETICLKALERSPARRYPTAREFADDLRRFLEDRPIFARRPGPLRRMGQWIRRHKALAAGLAVAIVGCAALGTTLAIQSHVRSKRILGLRALADQAMHEERWSRAAELYSQVERLAPETRTRKRASEAMARATPSMNRRSQARNRAASTTVTREIQGESAATKRERWSARAQIEEARREAREHEETAMQNAQEALALESSLRPAREILVNILADRCADAFHVRDHPGMEDNLRRGLAVGSDEFGRRVRTEVDIRTRPEGAQAFLFRYLERQFRLLPLPCDSNGSTLEAVFPEIDPLPVNADEAAKAACRAGKAYPLPSTSFNEVRFPLSLLPGSYLLVFQKKGLVETRLPLWIGTGGSIVLDVRLPEQAALPSGFVYVSEGPCILGGDPIGDAVLNYREESRATVGGFIVGRFSVTCAEYFDFLEDRAHHTFEEAFRRGPRTAIGRPLWLAPKGHWERDKVFRMSRPDDAVGGISFEDAREYARWYTKTHPGSWTFRLPTRNEWERTARGADGRVFPWGNRYDSILSRTQNSRPKTDDAEFAEPIGLFPADESPFGVRDMAGVVGNWGAWIEEGRTQPILLGGSFNSLPNAARATYACQALASSATLSDGFRLVASLPRD